MKNRVALSLLVLILTSSAAFAGSPDEHSARFATKQSPAEARATDIALIAEELELPIKSVDRAIAFQESFSEFANRLIARYPGQISAVWVEPVPNLAGHVRFTDAIPAEVAPEHVVFSGGGKISIEDHVYRAERAALALKAAGYRNLLAFYDPTTDVIQVELKVPGNAVAPTKEDVFDSVQPAIFEDLSLSGEALILDWSDLALTVIRGAGPIITDEHSRGGNWLLDDGTRECTSGWSVSGPHGNGIVTAGHCTGLNEFEEPGVTPYSMTHRRQEWGNGGDVEYHTTSHAEYAEFYASASSIRDVTGIKTTSTMVGGSVCVYGRSSSSRSCAHSVEGVYVVSIDNDGVLVGNLARTDNVTTTGGDSGGGWSLSNRAWGVHKGSGLGKSYFTPVQETQTALGVTILTQ